MPLVGFFSNFIRCHSYRIWRGCTDHALTEYYGKGNCPASGEIQLAADFYGTANTYDCQYLLVAGGGWR